MFVVSFRLMLHHILYPLTGLIGALLRTFVVRASGEAEIYWRRAGVDVDGLRSSAGETLGHLFEGVESATQPDDFWVEGVPGNSQAILRKVARRNSER